MLGYVLAALIGLSLAIMGGGGSILTVPALVYLVGMDTRAATTGSLVIVGVTAVFGMLAHRRDGHVRMLQGVVFGLVGAAGAVAGTRLSLAVAPDVLLAGFSVLMLLTTEGKQYTLAELRDILEAAGFVDIQATPTYARYSIVSGTRR